MGWILAFIALTWLVCMPLRFRLRARGQKALSLLFKAIPTALAAAFAGVAHFGAGATDGYGLLIFVGLCVCTLADVSLDVRFEVGGTLFFAGHVLYVLALSRYTTLHWWYLLLFAAMLCALWLFAFHYRPYISKPHIVCGLLVYSVALAALLALGLPLPFLVPSRRSALAALGAVLFVISDLTLCHNTVRKLPMRYHYISLGIYYMGQLLLGLSAFPAA